jgi:hypothetical protein
MGNRPSTEEEIRRVFEESDDKSDVGFLKAVLEGKITPTYEDPKIYNARRRKVFGWLITGGVVVVASTIAIVVSERKSK